MSVVSISGYAIDAARQIVPQYVTGEGAASERLKSVETMTTWVAGVIQETIDSATQGCIRDIEQLNAAIRKHRDQRGDDRCWMDDEELYKVLPEGYTAPERDTSVEITNCQRFIANRRNPNTVYVSPQREIEELRAEVNELRAEVNAWRARFGPAASLVCVDRRYGGWCPDRCPITYLPFFMWIEHPTDGLVPTYGGPYDSYTIPELDNDTTVPLYERPLIRQRYDHDLGGWRIDEYEEVDVKLIDDDELIGLLEKARKI